MSENRNGMLVHNPTVCPRLHHPDRREVNHSFLFRPPSLQTNRNEGETERERGEDGGWRGGEYVQTLDRSMFGHQIKLF